MALFKNIYTPHCEMHDCEVHNPLNIYYKYYNGNNA